MPAKGVTRAVQNRKIRQEALRDQLSAQGHVQHVIDISEQLRDLNTELDTLKIQRLKCSAEIKAKLINKYLPDLKAVEMTGPSDENGLPTAIKITIHNGEIKPA